MYFLKALIFNYVSLSDNWYNKHECYKVRKWKLVAIAILKNHST